MMCPIHQIDLVKPEDKKWREKLLICPHPGCNSYSNVFRAETKKTRAGRLVMGNECPLEEVEGQRLWARVVDNIQKYPDMKTIFHVPNGGHRFESVGAKLKAQGVRAGVPDYVWPCPRAGWHGCFVELKRVKGGTLQPLQAKWRDWMEERGFYWKLAHGADEAWDTLVWYHNLTVFSTVPTRAQVVEMVVEAQGARKARHK